MADATLTSEEVDVRRAVLGALVVRSRAGALGVLHGGRIVEAGKGAARSR